MSLASPSAWLRRSIAHVPTPRTWPPVGPPAVITCSQCGSPRGAVVLTTDHVKYIRCATCRAIAHRNRNDEYSGYDARSHRRLSSCEGLTFKNRDSLPNRRRSLSIHPDSARSVKAALT